ncbi:hypothetical protein [Actinomadura violacea]|uniref:Minor tail protein n=1 Tax=Actinomadura violacea TaxID=2819934 RepID=A0ABS3RZE6_9ACTN|nr:hypothetical protein [Actinomadura violacea]MBO2461663.1 hypothetical protein [Actinomadura violacea]
MAPVNPPTWQQAGTYSAKNDRQLIASLLTPASEYGALGSRPGFVPAPATGGMLVHQRTTPDMKVTVEPGPVFINATSSLGGMYACRNDAAYDVTVAAAHATLNRLDLVIARVYDAVDDVGALNQFTIEVLTGTPAAAPSRPDMPQQSFALAELSITAGLTAVTNAKINDLRRLTVALGGILPVNDVYAMPPNPYPGQKVWRRDLSAEMIYDGTNWQTLSYGVWTSYTPTWGSGGTQPVLGNGAATGRYYLVGKTCSMFAHIRLGSTSTVGTGTYTVSLPFTPRSGEPSQFLISRMLDGSAGAAWAGQAYLGSNKPNLTYQGTTSLVSVNPTQPFTFANTDELQVFGTYEIA